VQHPDLRLWHSADVTTRALGGAGQDERPEQSGAEPAGNGHIDGRLLRSIRTRDRVLDAFLALIEEGDLSPTAQRVAARAEVSLRTVFHQFEDLDTLHRLAGERLRERVAAVSEPVDVTLPLPQRLDAFTRRRVRVLTVLHPLASAARLREPMSQALRDNRDALRAVARAQLEAVFAPELDPLPNAARRHLVAALGLVTSWAAWWQLREESGLSPDEAGAVMRSSIAALLAGRDAVC
jgi:TetR/AcrR family transcriptional regulator of autoinduction and epiphytic fitness